VNPGDIEKESFRIIRSEMGEHSFSEPMLKIVVRVIHATADFEYKTLLRFSPAALESGIRALRAGCRVLTDVHMVASGVRKDLLTRLGGELICEIDHPEVVTLAKEANHTRAATAFRRNAALMNGSIVVVGNAPTALYEVIHQIRENGIRPALVIGVPVGFVSAAESKADLAGVDAEWILSAGRKGGSTVAAAILNAILLQASEG
jgi:precorrin-8X/cobalt-precorrin-8 methylmutase